jgi:hypothetical protein
MMHLHKTYAVCIVTEPSRESTSIAFAPKQRNLSQLRGNQVERKQQQVFFFIAKHIAWRMTFESFL